VASFSKPAFLDPGAYGLLGSMPLQPPFAFEGVKMMIFPLRANISKLNDFCRSYLSIKASQRDVFKPAAPYVFMMVLHYDKMASNAVRQARNIGWIAQHEITFTVPLEWWQWSGKTRGSGQLEFHDWAIVSPFIYVDDPISQTTGREVYGWPKVAGSLTVDPESWGHFPTTPTSILNFATYTQPRYSQGKRTAQQPLLEIQADPSPLAARFPPLASPAWAPWNVMANMASSSLLSVQHWLDEGLGLALRGYEVEDDRANYLLAASGKAFQYMRQASSGAIDPLWWLRLLRPRRSSGASRTHTRARHALTINNITIKQFPDIHKPHLACYQAIVNSPMGVKRLQAAGLLGESNLALGDLAAGYSIRIHDSLLHPIVDSLGLEVHATQTSTSSHKVSVLKPIFPYWSEIDLNYGVGDLLSEQYLPFSAANDGSEAAQSPESSEADYAYNSIVGAAATPVQGPFEIPDLFVRVYPIKAKKDVLSKFVASYNTTETESGLGRRLQLWAPENMADQNECMVYLVLKSVDACSGVVWSESASPDWLTANSFEICFPVVLAPVDDSRKVGTADSVCSNTKAKVILICPYVFSDSSRATMSDREVNGRPTQKSVIASSDDLFADMTDSFSPSVRTVLSVESFDSFGDGEEAQLRPLIEIAPRMSTADGLDSQVSDDKTQANSASKMGSIMFSYYPRISLDKLKAMEGASVPFSIDFLGLKQFRDAENPSLACYKALVRRRTTLLATKNYGPIEESVAIRIHKSASFPMVEHLGLVSQPVVGSSDGSLVFEMEPVDPFWFQVAVREDLGNIEALYEPKKGWAPNPDPNLHPQGPSLVTHKKIMEFLHKIHGREPKASPPA
jgi:hypothetical protein